MFHKINSVTPLHDYKIRAVFVSGDIRIYDTKPLQSRFTAFNDLTNIKGLFELVKVDESGLGIVWNENIDLSSDEIWYNGKP